MTTKHIDRFFPLNRLTSFTFIKLYEKKTQDFKGGNISKAKKVRKQLQNPFFYDPGS